MDLVEPYFQRNPKTFLNTQSCTMKTAAVTCYPSPNFLCPPGFVLADWLHSLRAHRLRCYFWSCSFGTRLRKTGLWKPHMHWWPRGWQGDVPSLLEVALVMDSPGLYKNSYKIMSVHRTIHYYPTHISSMQRLAMSNHPVDHLCARQ